MPQRDYAARSKKKKGLSKSFVLTIIVLLLSAGSIGLWVLKENAPTPAIPMPAQHQPVQPQGPALPSRPEEVYSYIRDLETREVLTDNSQKSQEKLAQLSAEQKQQLEAKLKQEQAARLAAETATPAPEQPAVVALTPEALEEKKAAELEKQKAERLAEEKRKQAELKKSGLAPVETAKPVETAASAEQQAKLAAEKAKAKKEQAKVVATAAKPTEKANTQGGRFGLQCGAFKNKAQAENMQARLAMAGFNARINSNADWNRVVVGPVGDRAAASTAQSNARSVAECVIVSM